ncbi:MAG: hypothetical protein ABJE95_04625 [Byssovorax sp.]
MGAALAAHVTLLLASPRAPRPSAQPPSSGHAEITIEVERTPPPPAPPAEPEPPKAAAAAEAPSKGPSAPRADANAKVAAIAKESATEPLAPPAPAATPPAEAHAETPAPVPAPTPPAAPARPGTDEYGGPVGGSDVATLPPGIGTARIWSIPGAIPSAAPPKPASTVATGPAPVDSDIAGRVLEGSLGRKDKAIGIDLPAAGSVAVRVADAVRTSAPLNARATFEVKLGAEGQVEGVRLVSASDGDASTWARVVASARAGIGATALKMKGDGKGATVTVKVESKVQYPAGSKEKLEMAPVCAEEELAKMADALQNLGNGLNGDLQRGPRPEPGMAAIPPGDDDGLPKKRKFCIPIGVRGTFDASNFGAHAVNVVKSTFSVTRPGEKAFEPDAVRPIDNRVPWAPEDPTKVRPAMPKKKKKKPY